MLTTKESIQIQRFANALYGVQVNGKTLALVEQEVASAGGALPAVFNAYYGRSFASLSSEQVASSLVTRLGITASGSSVAKDYVVDQLESTPTAQRGAKVAEILELYSSLGVDPIFGASAVAWNAQVDAALAQAAAENITFATSTVILLEVMDTRAVVVGRDPLLNSPYGGFVFTATNQITGSIQVVTLQSQAIDDAQTYANLAVALQAAANAALGTGAVSVSVGSNFTVIDSQTARPVTGQQISIVSTGPLALTTPAGSGWIAVGVVESSATLHTNFISGSMPTRLVITPKDLTLSSAGDDLTAGLVADFTTATLIGVVDFSNTIVGSVDNSLVI
jgi:hypothetical protein